MAFTPNLRKQTEKMTGLIGNLIYPVLSSLSMPVFLYKLVIEKEQKLVENMKVNGLRMHNYWIVNCTLFLIHYAINNGAFFLFGAHVTGLSFFKETTLQIIIPLYFGWGLCQAALSILFSSFLSKSQSASIIGYCFSIISCLITSTLLLTRNVFDY